MNGLCSAGCRGVQQPAGRVVRQDTLRSRPASHQGSTRGVSDVGKRYSAQWKPTALVIDGDGIERHRIEGFLPPDDFSAQLVLALGHAAFGAGQFQTAEERFRDVVDKHGFSDAAPEALYWAGVSRYKATNDPRALKETAEAFKKYPDSSWAKKASVWT